MKLTGIHHLSAVTADIAANKKFYTESLGLRLVKKTVNQDDVSAYHLFYSDGKGSPGTDITFFDYPSMRERRGTNSIARTGFRVDSADTLRYWTERFSELGITHGDVIDRAGRPTLEFEDPERQRLALVVDDGSKQPTHPWEKSPVPAEHQIRGLGPITLSVPDLKGTDTILTKLMNMQQVKEFASKSTDGNNGDAAVHVYSMGEGGPAAELHVAVEPTLGPTRPGSGGVHHVAFRIPTYAEYDGWIDRLQEFGVGSSGPVDRFYFRSLYFREPNGILFELATDEPGFHADEPIESMGEKLALPPFLEPRRKEIEAGLKPI